MNAISHYCQGYSHLSTEKPCQDCAMAEATPTLAMAIVSDGHGGERYFRSDKGSKLLVDITAEAIRKFAELGGGLGGIHLMTSDTTKDSEPLCGVVHDKLRWLFSSIIAQWNDAIERDAKENTLTDWEKANVEEKYLLEFEQAESHEKTYGCTLMAYFQTSTYWIAFQIGDGKLLTMSIKDDALTFDQPVPWDERCFLNKTTSICDSDALNRFRYCYCSDGTFPVATFLGSDGIDDTYGDGALLENFYMELFKIIGTKGDTETVKELRKLLPIISQRGSKDDMSVACVYDPAQLRTATIKIVELQLERTEQMYAAESEKIAQLQAKIDGLDANEHLSESESINLQYARKDLDKALKQKKQLSGRKGNIKAQLNRLMDK